MRANIHATYKKELNITVLIQSDIEYGDIKLPDIITVGIKNLKGNIDIRFPVEPERIVVYFYGRDIRVYKLTSRLFDDIMADCDEWQKIKMMETYGEENLYKDIVMLNGV